MKEYIVSTIAALDTPHAITDTTTGKVFKMVSLELTLMSPPPGKPQKVLLHFPPTLLQDVLPKLQGTIQMALTQPTDGGTKH